MSGSKFLAKMQELFGFTPPTEESKKKAIREIVKKLKLRRTEHKKELKEECDVIKRDALKDSIKIITRQIKKGKDILDA